MLLSCCALLATAGRAQSASNLVINEVCASNIDQWVDLSFNYGGWVEVYNPTDQSVNITGWYLSDDPDHLRRGRINQNTSVPAQGFVTLWLDHYDWKYSKKTLDLKLDTDGGHLYLSDSKGQLVAQAEYPEAVARCSWARQQNGGETWQYCATPTPGRDNSKAQFAKERLAAPVVDTKSLFFRSGRATATVTIPAGCELRYTTDGSAPTLTNGEISLDGHFDTSITRLYRFRLFREGYLPSPVVTTALIRDTHNFDLPILSVIGTYANFYSDSIGIFAKGSKNGRPGAGQDQKCNWNMDWERPAEFQYFTPQGELLFAQEVGIERCGGWSRAWQPWSFKIKASKQYEGQKWLEHDFFAEKPRLKHKALQIRNGGNDNGCRIKDAALQQIVATSGIDIDYQAYQPVAQFINGVFKGTINMREPNNKHFVLANYGIDDTELDQFEMSPDSGYVQKCGDDARWKYLLQLSKGASNQQTYEKVADLLDIDEFCNYLAVEFYLSNWDWPQNNVKGFTYHGEGGRFRFVLFDLDNSFSGDNPFTLFAGKKTHTFDWLYDERRQYTKEIEFVTLFLNLLNNETFRKQFIDTFCLVAYSVFDPETSKQIINEMANVVAHTQGFYNNESPWWTANDVISHLSAARQKSMITLLKNHSRFKLSGKSPQQLSVQSELPEARVTINGMNVPRNAFDGQLFAPITIEATAPVGYTFNGWIEKQVTTTTLMERTQSWKYYDQGSLDGMNWQLSDFDDAKWASGKAPLGYHTNMTRDYNTIISYGSNANSKRMTYYFRTTIDLPEKPRPTDDLVLDFTVDDGCVVYVNGQEAGRYNMPTGAVYYSTAASSYAQADPDTGRMKLNASLFQQGQNVIAVELHQNSNTSTDVYWAASLLSESIGEGRLVSPMAKYSLSSTEPMQLVATFRPSDEDDSRAPVVINELSASNAIYLNDYGKKADWIELYNITDREIDLAGLWLTDDPTIPDKWEITAGESSASTRIAPHGFKLIWCDKDAPIRELHAPFKLNNEYDSKLMLSAPDGSWADSLAYRKHLSYETVGRYPDGSHATYHFNRPSLGQSNRLGSTSRNIGFDGRNAIERVVDDRITTDAYAVYDLSGRLIERSQGPVTLALPAGIYIVRRGEETLKVTVK